MSGSRRDRLRALNFGGLDEATKEAAKTNTIVTNLVQEFNEKEDENEALNKPIEPKPEAITEALKVTEEKSSITNTQDDAVENKTGVTKDIEKPQKASPKRGKGRPAVYDEGGYTTVTMRLKTENYIFAKRNGWEYNGYTGYINHVLDEIREKSELD